MSENFEGVNFPVAGLTAVYFQSLRLRDKSFGAALVSNRLWCSAKSNTKQEILSGGESYGCIRTDKTLTNILNPYELLHFRSPQEATRSIPYSLPVLLHRLKQMQWKYSVTSASTLKITVMKTRALYVDRCRVSKEDNFQEQ